MLLAAGWQLRGDFTDNLSTTWTWVIASEEEEKEEAEEVEIVASCKMKMSKPTTRNPTHRVPHRVSHRVSPIRAELRAPGHALVHEARQHEWNPSTACGAQKYAPSDPQSPLGKLSSNAAQQPPLHRHSISSQIRQKHVISIVRYPVR